MSSPCKVSTQRGVWQSDAEAVAAGQAVMGVPAQPPRERADDARRRQLLSHPSGRICRLRRADTNCVAKQGAKKRGEAEADVHGALSRRSTRRCDSTHDSTRTYVHQYCKSAQYWLRICARNIAQLELHFPLKGSRRFCRAFHFESRPGPGSSCGYPRACRSATVTQELTLG